MNDFPNLDWQVLRKTLHKKSVETTFDPNDDPTRRQRTPRTPQRVAPPRQPLKSALQLLNEELEFLKVQRMDADEKNDAGLAQIAREKIKEIEEMLQTAMDHPAVQDIIEEAKKSVNPMDPSGMVEWDKKIRNVLDDILEKKMFYMKKEKGTPLETELRHTILREEYEKAPEIQQRLDRFQRIVQQRRVMERIVVSADNLDLTMINKPYDEGDKGQTRKRHQYRFRNEPGGQDELFWEGMGGTLNKDKGIGTDQYQDVGSPSSISLAKRQGRRWNPFRSKQEQGMPGEMMERDPLEERQTTESWREYNDMQER